MLLRDGDEDDEKKCTRSHSLAFAVYLFEAIYLIFFARFDRSSVLHYIVNQMDYRHYFEGSLCALNMKQTNL